MSADAQLKNGLIPLFGLDALWIIERRYARTTKQITLMSLCKKPRHIKTETQATNCSEPVNSLIANEFVEYDFHLIGRNADLPILHQDYLHA